MPRILVIDDHSSNRALARAILEGAGFQVEVAANAGAARRAWTDSLPDLVLMDLQLPGTDGYALTEELRATPALAHLPVLALTAYAMRGDRERALAAGCDDYLAKPVDPDELEARVRRLLAGVGPPGRSP